MEEFLTIEGLVVVLVLVATLVAILVRRIRLPYTVSLVLVGLFISIQRPIDVPVKVTPELILSIFVPPLIFEAAFHLDYRLLRENLASIIMLAVPGVILTTLFVGGMVALGARLSFATAAVFGALIAATDPVAVVALFRALGVPRQLAAAVEGESLFNDGTAIVVFNIALTAALTGVFDPAAGLFDFLRVAFGGMGIGLALGWLAAQLMARVDDRLIVSTLTTLLAYGSYLVAEHFHVSGVLAVVMAGLISGNVGLANVLWSFLMPFPHFFSHYSDQIYKTDEPLPPPGSDSDIGEAIFRLGLGSNLRPSGPQPQSSSASTSLQYATLGGILPKANLWGPWLSGWMSLAVPTGEPRLFLALGFVHRSGGFGK